jgi:hypothetical protein
MADSFGLGFVLRQKKNTVIRFPEKLKTSQKLPNKKTARALFFTGAH